ncbi:MAG: class I SAM-dependent methyltransferase [Betaproteobacteria bacterium]|nr:class I SAM-dependent methyltransferase [Betaproteobacteria bacterium]
MNRNITTVLNRVLDDFTPPIIRDSRWFYLPLLRLALGKNNYKICKNFKANINGMTEDEFAEAYRRFKGRITDLNHKCTRRIIDEVTDKTVLEVGCGSGWLAKKLAKNNKVSATDIVLHEDMRAKNLDITFKQANMEDLPFSDNEFDVVITTHTLEHVRKINIALGQLRRVCRERLIIVVPCQRPYRHTPDLHIQFFPYPHSLVNALNPKPGTYTCELVGGDLYYVEQQ